MYFQLNCIPEAIIIIVDVISIVAVEEGVGSDVKALGGQELNLPLKVLGTGSIQQHSLLLWLLT